ncbi:hypothetical protein SLE2022_138340 [Rubroshorea leprosula]
MISLNVAYSTGELGIGLFTGRIGLILASWFLSLGVNNAEVLCVGLVSVAVSMLFMPLFKATGSVLPQMAPPNIRLQH